MLFKLSLDTNTTFIKTFTFDAKQISDYYS